MAELPTEATTGQAGRPYCEDNSAQGRESMREKNALCGISGNAMVANVEGRIDKGYGGEALRQDLG